MLYLSSRLARRFQCGERVSSVPLLLAVYLHIRVRAKKCLLNIALIRLSLGRLLSCSWH